MTLNETNILLGDSKQRDRLVEQLPYLKMLVLFGSRARGDTHAKSDWDFAVLYDRELQQQTVNGVSYFEIYGVLAQLLCISDEQIDVIELDRCSELMAHHVARDGKLLYEQDEGLFEQFRLEGLMSDAALQDLRQRLRNQIEVSLQRRGA